MSLQKMTTKKIVEKKRNGEKIATITAYDYSFAKLVDQAGIDLVLVGDSLGQVVLGYKTALPVTIDDMIPRTQAVARGVTNALIVGDMPFLTYKVDKKDAILNAGRFIQAGAEAVKIEGGTEMVPTIEAIMSADIEVMGHIGLTPQKVYRFGGFMVQGKTSDAAKRLVLDAVNLERAGVFSIVLEGIPWQIAKIITEHVGVPTIGIGAGPYCDGQVLVIYDMLGLFTDFKPKFLKYYANLGETIKTAMREYRAEIESGIFPDMEHSYEFPEDQLDDVTSWVDNIDVEQEAKKLLDSK
jgi:3-methyl-2-oxobutanoate hydroxymethyltransferase